MAQPISVDPKVEISKLLQTHKFEEAFNAALSASNLELVTWLCSQLDPSTIFSPAPTSSSSSPSPAISQPVLLSLIQQLGFDLSKETGMKLAWLKEAAIAMDPQDFIIQNHAPNVLSTLLNNLEACLPKFVKAPHHLHGSSGNLTKEVKVLMHIVNSLKTEISAVNE
eukprot:TRINITY_DN2387_c0_g1_i1.p1 TRINITY_DN2387_c0_g1~~TRINITY_DN2387_c0_g1_i1.p1  ORF type:complete len:175 (-),score=66.04 TRINITY_DN2387_c0_g1_i1:25-525(-)